MKQRFSWHHVVQAFFCVWMIVIGVQFLFFVRWAMDLGPFVAPRPPAVEAFLPISALLATKELLLSGIWDTVHPAGLTIFLLALGISFVLRKSFCGYLCPLGTLQETLFSLGRRWHLILPLPMWAARVMGLPKYILLGFFLSLPLTMDLDSIETFLSSPYNLVADTKMLLFFAQPSSLLLIVLGLLLFASLFVPSFWCRAFCPYGALLGLTAFFSPLRVKRQESLCTQCGACKRHCPQGIHVFSQTQIRNLTCTGCAECVRHCPVDGALQMQIGERKIAPKTIAILVVVLLFLVTGVAKLTGHWESCVPPAMSKALHRHIESISH